MQDNTAYNKPLWSGLFSVPVYSERLHNDSEKWLEKSRMATQNRYSEIGGPGTGPSKHTGCSRSTVEHTIKLSVELRRPANSCDIFKKMHKRKDGSFVDTKSKSINGTLGYCPLSLSYMSFIEKSGIRSSWYETWNSFFSSSFSVQWKRSFFTA